MVMHHIRNKPDLLLCAPSGNSPAGLYDRLLENAEREPGVFRHIRIVKLDEWIGPNPSHPVSCEHFLRKRLLLPLGIPSARYISFRSDAEDPVQECRRIQGELEEQGPIDLCILGLGRNGHLGLNEPAPFLEPGPHECQLSGESMEHEMLAALDPKPQRGLTLGMFQILSARKILLLISGKGKKEVIHQFLQRKITTLLPASFLWMHPDAECLFDQQAME